jgi:hypothetical protein
LVCSSLTAAVAGSNPVESMDIRLVFVGRCVGSDLCYELTTGSEESYCVCLWGRNLNNEKV